MSRTTPILKLQNNGTFVGSGFQILDLISGISATDAGAGVANVSASGGTVGVNVATEKVTAVISGSDITLDLTTLAHTFITCEVVFRNGQALLPTTEWLLTGSSVTVYNAASSESFMVQYTY
jgi:hypothetical protein